VQRVMGSVRERLVVEMGPPCSPEVNALEPSVLLGGIAGSGSWREQVVEALQDTRVGVLNPVLRTVESDVEEGQSPARAAEERLWERDAAATADVVLMCVEADSTQFRQGMELGRAGHVFSKKLVVCCARDSPMREEAELAAGMDGFCLVDSVAELVKESRRRVESVVGMLQPRCVML
jgi:hypothetical protein